jgi:hypothetical protein
MNHRPRHDARAFRVRVARPEQCLPKAQLFVPTTPTCSRYKEHRTMVSSKNHGFLRHEEPAIVDVRSLAPSSTFGVEVVGPTEPLVASG